MNPVIEAGSQLVETERQLERMKVAFERENRLRDKIAKAVAAATGISEKVFVNETGTVIEERLQQWVKDLKNRARKGYADLEIQVVSLKEELDEQRDALKESRLRTTRIQGVLEQAHAELKKRIEQMHDLRVLPIDDLEEEEDQPEEEVGSTEDLSELEKQLLVIRKAERRP